MIKTWTRNIQNFLMSGRLFTCFVSGVHTGGNLDVRRSVIVWSEWSGVESVLAGTQLYPGDCFVGGTRKDFV